MKDETLTPGWQRIAALAAANPTDYPTVWLDDAHTVPMYFRRITARSFVMGSRGYSNDEEPRHRVTFANDFYLACFPVTQRQWFTLMGTTPAQMKAKGDAYGEVSGLGDLQPMVFVNHEDAGDFIIRVRKRPGGELARLPNEAQWECGCRADCTTEYANGDGDAALREIGWFDANSGGSTHPVGLLEPNAWDLYDMHGNVWEWCADAYDAQSYAQREDGWPAHAIDAGGDLLRVFRGGSFVNSARWCRAAYRLWRRPSFRLRGQGFRLCLAPESGGGGAKNSQERSRSREGRDDPEGGGGAGFSSLRVPKRTA